MVDKLGEQTKALNQAVDEVLGGGGDGGTNVSQNQDNSGFGADDAASIGVGFTPAGIVADVYTAATGEDFFTGEEVSGLWRWAGLIPFVSEARKLGNAAEAATTTIRQSGKHLTLTNPMARAQASSFGFKPVKNIPKSVQKHTGKNPVFYDKSTKSYFSPDKAGHRADNAWKRFDRDGNRQTGIFDNKGIFQRVSD